MSVVVPTIRDLIQERISSNSQPHKRSDPFHLALVIEGGGMRGVVAGGMVTGLEELGYLNVFDSIHGTSAGACAGAYFLAGQAKYGTSIYYEDINNDKFISMRRLLSMNVLNASYLIDNVMRNIKILNVDKIIDDNRLHIISTNIDRLEYESFSTFHSHEDFFLKLKSSIYIPIIAGKYIKIGRYRYCDGGVLAQIPIDSAIRASATHILILITTKIDNLYRKERASISRYLEYYILKKVYGQKFANKYLDRNLHINNVIDRILLRRINNLKVVSDFIIRPHGCTYISRLEKDKGLLLKGAKEGEDAVYKYFEHYHNV